MTTTGYARGHKIEYAEKSKEWVYSDTKEIVDGNDRPCVCCGKMPTPEGYDACLGHLDGVDFACCGHGVERGYKMINGERYTMEIKQIIPKDCIGRELRIGDTIVYYMNSRKHPSKRIIYETGMVVNRLKKYVPYIKTHLVNDSMSNYDHKITNMKNVVLIRHKPIEGTMPEFDNDYIDME